MKSLFIVVIVLIIISILLFAGHKYFGKREGENESNVTAEAKQDRKIVFVK